METAGLKQIMIAGGGLGGLSLGLGLRRGGIPVTIHESSSYPRHRVCGEFISGLGQETISTLGLEDSLSGARRHEETVWFLRDQVVFQGRLPDPALAISRYRLDERLCQALLREGGVVLERSRCEDSGREGTVWAAGRQRVKRSPWLGLKAHFFGIELSQGLEMHLGQGMYVGLTPVEDGRVNVCGLIRGPWEMTAKGPENFVRLMRSRGLGRLSDRLGVGRIDPESFQGVSALGFGVAGSRGSGCRIGDAHSLIPPFTGNGMTMAFQAAECVLPFIERYSRGHESWSQTVVLADRALSQRFRKRLRLAARLHPFLMRPSAQALLGLSGRLGCLPFQTLYRAVR